MVVKKGTDAYCHTELLSCHLKNVPTYEYINTHPNIFIMNTFNNSNISIDGYTNIYDVRSFKHVQVCLYFFSL